jgi:hypothetical protein
VPDNIVKTAGFNNDFDTAGSNLLAATDANLLNGEQEVNRRAGINRAVMDGRNRELDAPILAEQRESNRAMPNVCVAEATINVAAINLNVLFISTCLIFKMSVIF